MEQDVRIPKGMVKFWPNGSIRDCISRCKTMTELRMLEDQIEDWNPSADTKRKALKALKLKRRELSEKAAG